MYGFPKKHLPSRCNRHRLVLACILSSGIYHHERRRAQFVGRSICVILEATPVAKLGLFSFRALRVASCDVCGRAGVSSGSGHEAQRLPRGIRPRFALRRFVAALQSRAARCRRGRQLPIPLFLFQTFQTRIIGPRRPGELQSRKRSGELQSRKRSGELQSRKRSGGQAFLPVLFGPIQPDKNVWPPETRDFAVLLPWRRSVGITRGPRPRQSGRYRIESPQWFMPRLGESTPLVLF